MTTIIGITDYGKYYICYGDGLLQPETEKIDGTSFLYIVILIILMPGSGWISFLRSLSVIQ